VSLSARFATSYGSTARILLADDHPVIRLGVREMLKSETNMEFVGEACNGEEAVRHTLQLRPNILLLDMSMPGFTDIETARRILGSFPQMGVLLFTSSIAPQQIVAALRSGLRGVVLKSAGMEQLRDAIPSVLHREYWVQGRRAAHLEEALQLVVEHAPESQRAACSLTPDEIEVLRYIAEGYSHVATAKHLAMSKTTVLQHLGEIANKTGTSTRIGMARFALMHQLLP
jgi:two-component system nitrate/nitrite response regulator NarL